MAYDTVLMPPDETIQEALEKLRDKRDLHAQEVDDLLKLIEVKAGHIEKLERAIDALSVIVGPPPEPEEPILTDIVDRVRTFKPPSAIGQQAPQEAAQAPPPLEPEGAPQFQRSLKSRVLEVIQGSGPEGITLVEIGNRFPEGKMNTLKVYLSQWLSDRTIVLQGEAYVARAQIAVKPTATRAA